MLAFAPPMTDNSADRAPSAFRPVPRTGVIYVTSEATRAGFRAETGGQGREAEGELVLGEDAFANEVGEGDFGCWDEPEISRKT